MTILGNDCAVINQRNADILNAAEKLVNAVLGMPTKYLSGELSDATKAMREAVKCRSANKVIAHAKRLITDVELHPRGYMSTEALEAATSLKTLVRSYI